MAKVVLPLLSAEARGKIANALVFFPLAHAKGGQPVRRWLTPANPQSTAQGDSRLRTAATGNITSIIVKTGDLHTQLVAMMPAKKIWNAYFVERALGSNFTVINAAIAAFSAMTEAWQTAWDATAATLAMEDTVLSYSTLGTITAGEKLYIAAHASYLMGLACMASDPVGLTASEITIFGATLTGNA